MHSSLCLRRTSSISSSLNSSLSELAPDTESMALGSAGSEMLSEMKDIKKNNYFSKVKKGMAKDYKLKQIIIEVCFYLI